MKKKLFLILLCIAGMSAKAADVPQWATALINNNPGLIDSVSVRPADPKAPDYTTCVVYYNQPLQHAVPNSPRFHMQALVTVNNTVDYATAVNHVYCSGYNLTDAFYARPDSMLAYTVNHCMTEIEHRYKANFIQIEHRYFRYSAPDKCNQILQLLDATLGSVPTAIREVEGTAQEDDGYYNLWGQRVDKNTRGVVIHKGRKIVNK